MGEWLDHTLLGALSAIPSGRWTCGAGAVNGTREGELPERTANRRRIDGVWTGVIIVAIVVLIVGLIAAKMRPRTRETRLRQLRARRGVHEELVHEPALDDGVPRAHVWKLMGLQREEQPDVFKSSAPLLAIMTGSTTSFLRRRSRNESATASMMPAL